MAEPTKRHPRSAGILLYRRRPELQVLIAHMGGPYWSRKDERSWSIPKGEYGPDEDAFAAARREFGEELGSPAPDVDYVDLGEHRTTSGKLVHVWAGEAEFETSDVISNTFELEWPPKSGRLQHFPEIDRAEWVTPADARTKLTAGQVEFVDRLIAVL